MDLRLHSAEKVKTDGLDLRVQYGFDTPIGRLSTDLQGTYVLHFAESSPSDGSWINFRNTPHNPVAVRLRGVAGLEGPHAFMSTAIDLKGGYEDNVSAPNRPVSAWLTFDIAGGYRCRFLDQAIGGRTTVSLHALNVFNRQPPFLSNAVNSVGFDPENADLLGRRVSLRIEHEW